MADNTASSTNTVAQSNTLPSTGTRIEVFWPEDDAYYAGVVSNYTPSGRAGVDYDDGDRELLNLHNEIWRLQHTGGPTPVAVESSKASPVAIATIATIATPSTAGPAAQPPVPAPNATLPVVNTRIEVYWPDDKSYYPGVVRSYNTAGKAIVVYDDGDIETLILSEEVWRREDAARTTAAGE